MFDQLLAHEGVEEVLELRGRFGFMAYHGGGLEEMTDVIARAAAEQAFAAAGFEEEAVVAHADRGAELVGPAGELEQRVALAFRLALDGDQIRGQRLCGGELLSRRDAGAASIRRTSDFRTSASCSRPLSAAANNSASGIDDQRK